MSNQEAPRYTVQGVQVLQLRNGPYIEVAERVRLVHKAGKSFSFERGEALRIHGRWLYRVYITVDGQQYIGDAEIHFGAPQTTPDGTNPITCGQTSAIGNALAFAGFGNLKSALARLGLHQGSEIELPSDSSHQRIEDIEVVMLNEQPYVAVAERIYYVHMAGKAFSIQQCKIIQYNNVWIYRASIMVDEQPYIGDAEIYFDAQQEPDRTYPVSCGQTSAVGNALAFAGFGDVRSILERSGKEVPDGLECDPHLASADALSRALHHASSIMSQEERHPPENSYNGKTTPARNAASRKSNGQRFPRITPTQRDRIRVLCERLGESEPDYAMMTGKEADVLLTQLARSEKELLLAADDSIQQEHPQHAWKPQDTYVSREAVGVLKEAWLQAFCVIGSIGEKRDKWASFKRETCQVNVDDTAMFTSQHDQLLAAIIAEEERRATHTPASQTATPHANGVAS